jgi:hypothetical protein
VQLAQDVQCLLLLLLPPARNVTITGLPGQRMPLWNLRFQRASVELCASCAFTMDSIAIANERRGNGAAVDLFVGAQGAPHRMDLGACTAAAACSSHPMNCTCFKQPHPHQQHQRHQYQL